MMTQYPYGIGGRHLAGPEGPPAALTDPLAQMISDKINNALQGGPKGSEQNKAQVEFFSDVLSLTGQKFVASDKGKKAIDDATTKAVYGILVPLSLAAFVAGYLLGSRKG